MIHALRGHNIGLFQSKLSQLGGLEFRRVLKVLFSHSSPSQDVF